MHESKTVKSSGELLAVLFGMVGLVGIVCLLCWLGGGGNAAIQKIDRDAKTMDGMMELMMKSPSKPKDGEYRIVDNHDGTYSMQSFWSDPRWQDVGRAKTMTLEEARVLKKMLEHQKPTVVE